MWVCEFESEFSAKTICINKGNEDKFRFVAICVFVRKTNRTDQFRIEQIHLDWTNRTKLLITDFYISEIHLDWTNRTKFDSWFLDFREM